MKIERVRIDGFGHFESFALDLKPGLNVVFGPNEAGKSTLLAFIRAVLFGFGKRSQVDRYEPAKGPFGGELHLTTRSGPLVVRRSGTKRAEGELSVRTPDGEPRPEAQLSDALCGISRELFCEVFAFGLTELSSFERLASQGGVSQALFAAAIQGGQRYPQVSDALRRASESVFSPKGAKPELNQLLTELNQVQDALRQVGDRPAAYVETLGRRDALEARAAAVEKELEAATAEREVVARLAQSLPELAAFDAASAELTGLPPLGNFPADAEARLEERLKSLAQAKAELARASAEATHAAARVAELAAAPAASEIAAELKAALEAYAARTPQLRSLAGKRAALIAKKRQLGTSLDELGLGLDADALVDIELGAAAKNRLATVRDEIAEAQRIHRERDEAYKQARSAREKVEGDIRRLTAEQRQLSASPSAVVRRKQSALAQVPHLQSEVERSLSDARERTRRAQAERQHAEAAPSRLFPLSVLSGALLGLAAVVGIAFGVWGGGAAGGSALACGATAALLIWLQRRAARAHAQSMAAYEKRGASRAAEAERLETEGRGLEARAADKRRTLADVAEQAGVPPDASSSAVEAQRDALAAELSGAERREALSRELESFSSTLAGAVADEKNNQADRDVAAARASKLGRVLEAFTSERSFPKGLSAERALDLWAEAAGVRQRLLDLRAEQEAVAADERSCAEVGDALVALAKRAGLKGPSAEGASHQARALLEREARRTDDLKAARTNVDAIAAQLSRAEELERQARGALQALFAETACSDEASVRRAAASAGRVQALEREARERRVKVEASSLRSAEEARSEIQSRGGPAAVAAAAGTLAARIAELSAQKAGALDERGRLRQQLEAWEKDEQISALREKEEDLSARATRLARQYALDRMGLLLLSRARERYQEAHQPRVSQLASRTLAQLTGGKYVRVRAAEDGRELLVRDASGKEWAAESLSRGTREQLYLAFRLAVVEDFGETLAPLPIILDDILVNFDLERTRNTLEVLARLGERHQVVAFTCHPSLKDAFLEQGARLVELGPQQQALLRLQAV